MKIDDLIMEFTKLLIKQDLEDKRIGQTKMIKQVEMYKGIIRLLKMIKRGKL